MIPMAPAEAWEGERRVDDCVAGYAPHGFFCYPEASSYLPALLPSIREGLSQDSGVGTGLLIWPDRQEGTGSYSPDTMREIRLLKVALTLFATSVTSV